MKNLPIETINYTQVRKPKQGNIELIAMNLTVEYMGIDSECWLFRVVAGSYLSNLIERSVYNRRKQRLRGTWLKNSTVLRNISWLIQSPLYVCKNFWTNRSTIFTEQEHSFLYRGIVYRKVRIFIVQTAWNMFLFSGFQSVGY